MPVKSYGRLELLTPENSVLLLVDYQPAMFKGIGSSDKVIIWNAAVGAAKAAAILGVPVVLSAISPDRNGEVIPEITGLFPEVKVIARKIPSFDALEDARNLSAIKKQGKPKMVVSGLWTSMCFTFTALHALREGLEVYGLMDASGDSTPASYKYGVKRMIQAGVIPVTTEALVSEWMHGWDNPKSGELVKEVYSHFGALIGLK